jgi:hypothetical protein
MSIRIGDGAFIPVTDGTLSATGTAIIALPECDFKADYSGTAELTIGRVK